VLGQLTLKEDHIAGDPVLERQDPFSGRVFKISGVARLLHPSEGNVGMEGTFLRLDSQGFQCGIDGVLELDDFARALFIPYPDGARFPEIGKSANPVKAGAERFRAGCRPLERRRDRIDLILLDIPEKDAGKMDRLRFDPGDPVAAPDAGVSPWGWEAPRNCECSSPLSFRQHR